MINSLLWNLLLTAGLAVMLFALSRLPWLHRRPALRCWLWLLLFVKLVTPPVIEVPLLPVVANRQEPVTVVTDSPPSGTLAELLDLTLENRVPFSPTIEEMQFSPVDATNVKIPHEVNKEIVLPEVKATSPELSQEAEILFWEPYLPVLQGLSLLGTFLFLLIYGWAAVRLHRWLKRAGRENPELTVACEKVASILKIRKSVRGCVVETRTTPLLWTWGKPTVAVPRPLLEEITPEQLQQIVAHELAHLLRRDHWANLFVSFVKILLWWNPIVWWAERELHAAQELCCDAIAIDCCQANRRGYATTLLQALEFIQAEPSVSHALALRMGSKRSMIRRFKMIGETRLSYKLSWRTLLLLLALTVPLFCIPVRAQEKEPEPEVTVSAALQPNTRESNETTSVAEVASSEPPQTENASDAEQATTSEETMDSEIRKLGEAALKRISTYSDETTLTLKDGETGRITVKKNITPVAEILITAHLVENGTQFDLEGIDADGKVATKAKAESPVIHDGKDMRMSLNANFVANGEPIFAKIQLTPNRSEDKTVTVKVKALFASLLTEKEIEAIQLIQGKSGKVQSDFSKLTRLINQHQQSTGKYPESLDDLKQTLPKDAYSPSGEAYHYEPQKTRFILSSCGKDGIDGNDDDDICIVYYHQPRMSTGQRDEMYPLEKEEEGIVQKENAPEGRPQGNCSISGQVLDAETDKPVANARVYLFHVKTFKPIFINTANDGTFSFENIPQGPFSLRTTFVPGYQDYIYNPKNEPDNETSFFSLNEGEHRKDLVFKLKKAYRISGKVVDENGKPPIFKTLSPILIVAWYKEKDAKIPYLKQSSVTPDGSYAIDGLDGEPIYVMAISWDATKKWDGNPPIFYPSTFFQEEAKQVTFGDKRLVENIDITLKKEGGITVEGIVRDEAGKPVPETLVFAHHLGLYIDIVATYTDDQGSYKLQHLGSGEYNIHADSLHRGFIAARDSVTLDRDTPQVKHDFTLVKGITISGKFVDEEGNEWNVGESHGHAQIIEDQQNTTGDTFWASGLGNQYNKMQSDLKGMPVIDGPGSRPTGQMCFPTGSTFLFQAMPPGKTKIDFSVKKEGQTVKKILYQDKDVTTSGIETQAGANIKDVTIVIGKEEAKEGEAKEEKCTTTGSLHSGTDSESSEGQTTEKPQKTEQEEVKPQKELVYGERLHGDCSISGKIVSAETGEPLENATVHLFSRKDSNSLTILTSSDGMFHFNNIPEGPLSLNASHKDCQDVKYNPENQSGQLSFFSLNAGESRSGIVFKLQKAYRISGKVLDENGNVPKHVDTLRIKTFYKKGEEPSREQPASVNPEDGSYQIGGLSGEPVYVVASNSEAARQGDAYPPIYYPSTFFREEAKLVTFDEKRDVDHVDVTLKEEGGLTLEGTVLDEAGKPVPEAFVVAHRNDMYFDFVTDYTDEQGKYHLQGLEDTDITVHVDAIHRGFVKRRTPIHLDREKKNAQLDFTLLRGATISGKLVDEEGNDWQIAKIQDNVLRSFGHATVVRDPKIQASLSSEMTFGLNGFWNKYVSSKRLSGFGGGLTHSQNGNYLSNIMIFPTPSTFTVAGMIPGQTDIQFWPQVEGQKIVKVLYNGEDVTATGIETQPGEEINDVTVVIGKEDVPPK